MPPHLPGFNDPVHDAQRTFRSLLEALARPGLPQRTAVVSPPPGLGPGCGAACLTLLDLETAVWLQPGLAAAVGEWLVFHTGCRLTPDPAAADFAVIGELAAAPDLEAFKLGTPEYPEASTSLLVQLPALTGGPPVRLRGPGMLAQMTVELPVSAAFWGQWRQLTAGYPLGLDIWWFAGDGVIGLPRTAQVVEGTLVGDRPGVAP